MTKQKKTRKFAVAKKIISNKDPRMFVPSVNYINENEIITYNIEKQIKKKRAKNPN